MRFETANGTAWRASLGRDSLWVRLHLRRRRVRWPLKIVVGALAVALVLYPKVWLVHVWIGRLCDLNSVLEPDHPALAEMETAVRELTGPGALPADVRTAVERVVYERVPYEFDWNSWGVVDYLPTVDEVFARGKEDCDGRAVVAASLLRRMGHEAWLTTDLKHMWVVTRAAPADAAPAEIMSPGRGAKTLVGGAAGTKASLTLGTLANLGGGLSFGIAVFPLAREILLLLVLCALMLHPWSSAWRRIAGCGLLGAALVLLRLSGASPVELAARPGLAWGGLAAAIVGVMLLGVKVRRPGRPAGSCVAARA